MQIKLRYKIISLILFTTLISVAIFSVFVTFRMKEMDTQFVSEMQDLLKEELSQEVKDIYSSCETANNIMKDLSLDALKLLEKILEARGGLISSNHIIEWNYIDPYTKAEKSIKIEGLKMGDDGETRESEGHTGEDHLQKINKILDEIFALEGNNITIYQPINKKNDLLIVATTLKNQLGNRISGRVTPAIQEDGSVHPLVKNINTGTIFNGSIYVNDILRTVSGYPLFDKNGKLIAIISTSPAASYLTNVYTAIKKIKNRDFGYGFAINNDSRTRGQFLVSSRTNLAGLDSLKIKDINGLSVYSPLFNKIKTLKDTEVRFITGRWQDPSENAASLKTIAYTYYEPWDWIIGATSFHSDVEFLFNKIDDLTADLLLGIIVAGILTLLVTGTVALFFSSKISKPISESIDIARNVADGNLKKAILALDVASKFNNDTQSQDETIELKKSINSMVQNLSDLINKIKNSSKNLLKISSEITFSAKNQEKVTDGFIVSGSKIEEAVHNIQNASNNLSDSIERVSEKNTKTSELAKQGKNQITTIEKSMDQMTKSTFSISSKLGVIEEQAVKINSIIETISKITSQTNLLALNTSIEAEKSGKDQPGFLAISKEIQTLSEQSSIASLSIEKMIQELQKSVKSGVEGMDTFKSDIKNGIGIITELKNHMSVITEGIESFSPEFEKVKAALQSAESNQINRIITSFKDLLKEANASFNSFNHAAESLNDSVSTLNQSVSKFDLKK